jgi:3-hydroxyacyl-[acyl-carrier-protein] dehydratase
MDWDKEEIKRILPHREPFLFVDRIVSIEGNERVIAVKDINGDEAFFRGHFPGRPIMPGVLIVEAMAQTSLILYHVCKPEVAKTRPEYYLGRVKAEFLHPVYPGDRLFIEVKGVKITDNAGVVDALARVEDRIVARASLVFGVRKTS